MNYVPWIINATNVTLRLECVGYKMYRNYWLNNLQAITKLRLYNLTVLLVDNANSAGQIICCRILFKKMLNKNSFIEKFPIANRCIVKPVCHTSTLIIITKDFIMQMRKQKFKTSKLTTRHLTVTRLSQFTRKGSIHARTHTLRLLGTSKDYIIQTPSKQNDTLGRVTKMQGRMAEKELINPFTMRKR